MNLYAQHELMMASENRARVNVVVIIPTGNNARTKTKNELCCSAIFASSTPATTTNTESKQQQITDKNAKSEKGKK